MASDDTNSTRVPLKNEDEQLEPGPGRGVNPALDNLRRQLTTAFRAAGCPAGLGVCHSYTSSDGIVAQFVFDDVAGAPDLWVHKPGEQAAMAIIGNRLFYPCAARDLREAREHVLLANMMAIC